MKENLLLSFSGGRTSAYMTKQVLDNYSDKYNISVVFANTGLEHEKTLEFINNCDKYFGFNTVYVEAIAQHNQRKSALHKLVTFETASRKGEPFEDKIKKTGIPNQAFPDCTRDLKLAPINSYLKSIGWGSRGTKNGYTTAIGIRTDETRRVSKSATKNKIVYPLIDWFPSDKQDILDWWKDQPFDLEIPEYLGNCKTCWKKSTNKLIKVYKDSPEEFEFFARMEREYPRIGPEFKKDDKCVDRVFFRKNLSVVNFIELAKATDNTRWLENSYENSGCSESCELYETISA